MLHKFCNKQLTNEEEKTGQNMSEEWRKFESSNKISGGKYLRVYLEEMYMNGRIVSQ